MDFTIQTIFDPDDSLIAPLTTQFQGQTITDRVKPQFSVPVGMAGFRRVHWEITGAATYNLKVGSVHVAYCKPTGSVCSGIENYPPVKEGDSSYSSCLYGYRGYSYRVCSGGILGEAQYDQCYPAPTQPPTTQPPTTQLPTTQSPTTQSPTTQAPTTQSPTTQSPTTQPPTTQSPTTQPPTSTCPATPLFPESPINAVMSASCDGDLIGDKTYTCQLVDSHPEGTMTDSTCRSP